MEAVNQLNRALMDAGGRLFRAPRVVRKPPTVLEESDHGVVDEYKEESMTVPVLVTGGTGTLGRLVVARLQDAGCEISTEDC